MSNADEHHPSADDESIAPAELLREVRTRLVAAGLSPLLAAPIVAGAYSSERPPGGFDIWEEFSISQDLTDWDAGLEKRLAHVPRDPEDREALADFHTARFLAWHGKAALSVLEEPSPDLRASEHYRDAALRTHIETVWNAIHNATETAAQGWARTRWRRMIPWPTPADAGTMVEAIQTGYVRASSAIEAIAEIVAESGAWSAWNAHDTEGLRERLASAIRVRRYNLPVRDALAWPNDADHPDTVSDLFLRQRLFPRTAEEWPHELWESIAAVLMRELARSPRLGPWLREFDARLRSDVVEPLLADGAFTREEFLRRLEGLRLDPPAHRRKHDYAHPPEVVRALLRRWTTFLHYYWTPTGYNIVTLQRLRVLWDSAAAPLEGVMTMKPKFPEEVVAQSLRIGTKPEALARELVALFFAVDESTVRKYVRAVERRLGRR